MKIGKALRVTSILCASLTACARPIYLDNTSTAGGAVSGKTFSACVATSGAASADGRPACISMVWEKRSTETEYGSFLFSIVDAATLSELVSTNAESVAVELWMPSMGHGSSPVYVDALSPGVYRARHVFFTMKGDWEIRFTFLKAGSKFDETKLTLAL